MSWRDKATKVEESEIDSTPTSTGDWRSRATKAENTDIGQEALQNFEVMDGPKGREELTLPRPNSNMYDNDDPENAQARYEAYKKSKDYSRNWLGQEFYKDDPLLDPERAKINQSLEASKEGLTVENVAGGIYNTGRETARTFAAANDLVNQGIEKLPEPLQTPAKFLKSGFAPSLALDIAGMDEGDVAKAAPRFEASSEAGKAVSTISEILTGVAVGTKLSPQLASRFFTNLMRTATEAGVVAASGDENQDLLTIDDEGDFLAIIPALSLDENGKSSDSLLKKRLFAFVDAFATAQGGELAGRAAMATSTGIKNLFNSLKAIGGDDALARETGLDIAKTLGRIRETDTDEEVIAKMQGVVDALRSGKNETFKSGVKGIDNVTVNRDSSGAFMAGRNNLREQTPTLFGEKVGRELSSEEQFAAEGLRAEVNSKGGGKIQNVLNKPSKQFEEATRQTREAFGGDEAMEATGQAVRKDAQRQIDEANLGVTKADQNVQSAADELAPEKLVKEQEDVTRALQGDLDESRKIRNEKFDIVRKLDTDADAESFLSKWTELKENLDPSVSNQVDNLLGKHLAKEGDNVTFAEMYNDLKPDLERIVTRLKGNGKFGDAKIVSELTKDITGPQLERLVNSPNRVTALAAKDAQEEVVRYGKKYNQGIGKDFRKSQSALPGYADRDRLEAGRKIIQKAGDATGETGVIARRELTELLPKEGKSYLDGMDIRRSNLAKAKEELKVAQDSAKQVERDVTDKFLKNWRDSEGFDIPGVEALPKYFGSGGEVSVVKRLVDKASKDSPEALNGIKSAFAEHLMDATRQSSQTSGGRIPLRADALRDKKLISMGDAIYGKDSTEWKLLQGVLKEALDIQNSSQAHKVPIAKLNKIESRTRGIVDVAVTQVWGHLSRIGSRVRSVARLAIPNSKERVIDSYDSLMANPGLLADTIESEISRRQGKLGRESWKKIYRAGALIGAYSGDEKDENEFVNNAMNASQTNEIFKK